MPVRRRHPVREAILDMLRGFLILAALLVGFATAVGPVVWLESTGHTGAAMISLIVEASFGLCWLVGRSY